MEKPTDFNHELDYINEWLQFSVFYRVMWAKQDMDRKHFPDSVPFMPYEYDGSRIQRPWSKWDADAGQISLAHKVYSFNWYMYSYRTMEQFNKLRNELNERLGLSDIQGKVMLISNTIDEDTQDWKLFNEYLWETDTPSFSRIFRPATWYKQVPVEAIIEEKREYPVNIQDTFSNASNAVGGILFQARRSGNSYRQKQLLDAKGAGNEYPMTEQQQPLKHTTSFWKRFLNYINPF